MKRHCAEVRVTLLMMLTMSPIPWVSVCLTIWDYMGLGAKTLNGLLRACAQDQQMSGECGATGKPTHPQSLMGGMCPPARASLMDVAFLRLQVRCEHMQCPTCDASTRAV